MAARPWVIERFRRLDRRELKGRVALMSGQGAAQSTGADAFHACALNGRAQRKRVSDFAMLQR